MTPTFPTDDDKPKRKRGRPMGSRTALPPKGLPPERIQDHKALAMRLNIQRRYYENHQSIGQIAQALNISRMRVYSEITATSKSLQVQIDAQISSIVIDSVAALSALADDIRLNAEKPVQSHYERESVVRMYATMYDRVFPLITEYWKRNAPVLPTPPPLVMLRTDKPEGEHSNEERNGTQPTGSASTDEVVTGGRRQEEDGQVPPQH